MIGIIAGLFDAGVDATAADLIIGTSAGSTAAAQITSAAPTELLATAFGDNMMDLSRRPPAAQAGYTKAEPLADTSPNSGTDPHERRGVQALSTFALRGGFVDDLVLPVKPIIQFP